MQYKVTTTQNIKIVYELEVDQELQFNPPVTKGELLQHPYIFPQAL